MEKEEAEFQKAVARSLTDSLKLEKEYLGAEFLGELGETLTSEQKSYLTPSLILLFLLVLVKRLGTLLKRLSKGLNCWRIRMTKTVTKLLNDVSTSNLPIFFSNYVT